MQAHRKKPRSSVKGVGPIKTMIRVLLVEFPTEKCAPLARHTYVRGRVVTLLARQTRFRSNKNGDESRVTINRINRRK